MATAEESTSLAWFDDQFKHNRVANLCRFAEAGGPA